MVLVSLTSPLVRCAGLLTVVLGEAEARAVVVAVEKRRARAQLGSCSCRGSLRAALRSCTRWCAVARSALVSSLLCASRGVSPLRVLGYKAARAIPAGSSHGR